MKYFLNVLLFGNLFVDILGFATPGQLANQSVKLRNSKASISTTKMLRNDDNVIDRKDLLNIPAKFMAATTIASMWPFIATAQDNNDVWTKHNGKFSEDEIKDYMKTDSGLLYKDIEAGSGKSPNDGDAVSIEMVGYIFETGDKWCNTYKGIPAYGSTVRAGVRENQKFMKGLNEGVKTMKRGGKRILVIPAYLAYSYTTIFSEQNPEVPIIPGGSALVCYVEMLDFKKLS